MRRRDFIAALGGAVTLPLAARAQQAERVRRIGVLIANAEGDSQAQSGLAKFTKALLELGWTDGRNIRIDYRWAAAEPEATGRTPGWL